MSGSRHINTICVIITIIAVLFTVLFMNGTALGIEADDSVSFRYEDTLFDDSYVHTIDIAIDDWDDLIANATAEEYHSADITIDGETIRNVGIRAKGNTSLSTVAQLDSERYSFKVEFDCYEASTRYHGLDKLCLNNLIQDYTMMKDYLAYKLMYEFGAASPLASYAFVTVNGEDWGLYLAVEAVEESFLERSYGTNYGNLYKPDSMDMGGGRGNGKGFDMRDVDFDKMGMENPFERNDEESEDTEGMDFPGEPPEGMDFSAGPPEGMDFPSDAQESISSSDGRPGRKDFPGGRGSFSGNDRGGFPGGGPGGPGGGFPGMGSDAAKLKYTDDEIDSYSTIFDSAKTAIRTSDKNRLIRSLKALSEGLTDGDAEQIESAVSVEDVMRYMVVHNFVVNGDSYTGSMIHNYYLYEENGRLSMIPWDYNLGFGTFQASESTSAVNDPIDTPLAISEGDTDRPMFSWINATEEYQEAYHNYYREFLAQFYESGYLTDLVNSTADMIRDYVDRDPTKFCTTEEFEKGVQAMLQFVTLRCESIEGQLDGSIPSTDAGQEADSSSLIDASDLTLSDMGSMGGGRGGEGGGPGGFPGGDFSGGDFSGGDFSGNGFPGGGPRGERSKNIASDQDVVVK